MERVVLVYTTYPSLVEAEKAGRTVVAQRLGSAHWESVLKSLIDEHVKRTGSPHAKHMLAHWKQARGRFWQICPKEMLPRLKQPLTDADETTPVAAA